MILARVVRRTHLLRARMWLLLAPVILLTELKNMVWVVVALSLYANFTGDVGAWEASQPTEAPDDDD